MGNRLEVTEKAATEVGQIRARAARRLLGDQLAGVRSIEASTIYLLDRTLPVEEAQRLASAVIDEATQVATWSTVGDADRQARARIDVVLRAGVTDPFGAAFEQAARLTGVEAVRARSGSTFRVIGDDEDAIAAGVNAVHQLFRNDIVDEAFVGRVAQPRFVAEADSAVVERIPVIHQDDDALAALSRARGLSLDPAELSAVRDYFASAGREPTDAELETIAQTWSEHCSHKTFRAAITWEDGTSVEPLLTQLRKSTESISSPYVVSAFVDNAGIVSFDDRFDIAIKVETHNHPSAVEPFGGANTGVGGVIRDVLGVAADPIAATDILCFGPPDMSAEDLPVGVLHPSRIRDGVVAGVADYGNKLGIPTVAGAVVHHPGFTANPLVFCGCIGLRPAGLVLEGQQPGHRIVALGGATGRDGIRGATFSSATMDASTGDVAGASVQIGDPIVERLVADVLRIARDESLFSAITDCGAGGFSSAIGELAADLGADVDLDGAPRKYPGLAPWEVWLSEAQERMVLAVPPAHVGRLTELCAEHGVGVCDLGSFRSDGWLMVRCAGSTIVELPGSFLHDGRPQRSMVATRPVEPEPSGRRDAASILSNASGLLLQVLRNRDVRSNEDIVRGYDHEILGATIGRPYQGAADDGPANGAVLAPLEVTSGMGLAVGIGVAYRSGHVDAYRSAAAAIDEAIRNVVCLGADPDRLVLLDNFSWGDPRRPETLGQLVEAVRACVDEAARFGAPFVSGKDSLNNEYDTGDGVRRSIPPTLVITALGVVPHALNLTSSDAKAPGSAIVLVGEQGSALRGSILDAELGIDGPGVVPGPSHGSPLRYRAVHRVLRDGLASAAHDVSDGGLLACVAEMCIGGRLGALIDGVAPDPTVELTGRDEVIVGQLFGEDSGRVVLEVDPSNVHAVVELTGGRVIGQFVETDRLSVVVEGQVVVDLPVPELITAWRGHVGAGE
jgi:phosphoribosylformylglycinamidine synthase subunit PurSL